MKTALFRSRAKLTEVISINFPEDLSDKSHHLLPLLVLPWPVYIEVLID